jgi:hypothetical protein
MLILEKHTVKNRLKTKIHPRIQALFIRPSVRARPASKKVHLAVDFSLSIPREEANKGQMWVSRGICARVCWLAMGRKPESH